MTARLIRNLLLMSVILFTGMTSASAQVDVGDSSVPIDADGGEAIRTSTGDTPTQALINGVLNIREPANILRTLIVEPVSFLILVGVMVFGLRRADNGRDIMWAILMPVVLSAFVASGSQMVNLVAKMGDSAAKVGVEATGIDYRDISSSLRNFAFVFSPDRETQVEELNDQVESLKAELASNVRSTRTDRGSTPEDRARRAAAITQRSELRRELDETRSALDSLGASTGMFDFAGRLRETVNAIISVSIAALSWVAGFCIDFMLIFRLFLLIVGGTLLPIFIAGLGTQIFRSQGINYAFGLIAIAAWPVGWMLGHLGTVALFDWVIQYTNSLLGLFVGSGVVAVVGYGAQGAMMVTAAAAQSGATALLTKLPVVAIPLMGLALLSIGVLAAWVMLVTISMPIIISRVVANGAQLASGLVGGTIQTGVGMAGGMASVGLTQMSGLSKTANAMLGGAGGGSGGAGGGGNEDQSDAGAGGGGSPNTSTGSTPPTLGATPSPGDGGSEGSQSTDPSNNSSEPQNQGEAVTAAANTESAQSGQTPSQSGKSRAMAAAGKFAKGVAQVGLGAFGAAAQVGFAGARTLSNASKWSGDPGSFASVPDSGFDEGREYRMQDQIRQLSSTMSSNQGKAALAPKIPAQSTAPKTPTPPPPAPPTKEF